MKKDRKGFTMIEILAVLIILGILAGLVVPAVMKYVHRGKTDYYDSLEKEAIIMAKDYYSVNKSKLPNGKVDSKHNVIYRSKVGINDLRKGGFVTNDIVDESGKKCGGNVIVEFLNGAKKYNYKACLTCGSYQSKNCKPEELEENNNPEGPKDRLLCNITYKSGGNEYKPGSWTNQDVELTITSSYDTTDENKPKPTIYTYETNGGVLIKANDNIGKYTINKTTKKDEFKIYTYDNTNVSSYCEISDDIKIEKEAPICNISSVAIKNGTQRRITVKGTDSQSGIKSITINGININQLEGTNLEKTGYFDVNKNDTYKAIVTDMAGNINTELCEEEINDLDKTPPEIAFSSEGEKGEIAVGTCSDPESGIKGETRMTQTLTGSGNKIVSFTCINNAGMTTTDSHVYKWNSCKKGSDNTYYDCDTCYRDVSSGCGTCDCYDYIWDYVCDSYSSVNPNSPGCAGIPGCTSCHSAITGKKWYTCYNNCGVCGEITTTESYDCNCSWRGTNSCEGGWNL